MQINATIIAMRVARRIALPQLLQQKSFFLFGPRATGKSTCIDQQLQGCAEVIDLLDSETFFKIANDYRQLEAIIAQSKHHIVVIDEIQKLPQLLNDVHRMIEQRRIRFSVDWQQHPQVTARRCQPAGRACLGGTVVSPDLA